MASEDIRAFWSYVMRAPKGGKHHAGFALHSLKTNRWATFHLFPRDKARSPRPGLSDPTDREGRLAGVGVYATVGSHLGRKGDSWLYLGAIEPGTHELKIAGERTQLLVPKATRPELTKTLQWLVDRLKADQWPVNNIELWHLGICRGCYDPHRCCDAAPAPPYPECIACREKRDEEAARPIPTVTPADDIDDELPANVHRFPHRE
jgi:hypothetical protein